ncbi:formin-like protein 2 [Vanessa atalanta]|uniref:formin-like protein 2 n=1 Tax=Vanessa atalanta TaxID=42275 RepID=UPI001FCDE1DC|nr:formin-like protein 2 [Vanessa atalanta]
MKKIKVPQTGRNLYKELLMAKTMLIMVSSTCFNVQAALPWEHWSWSMPQAPIGHFFRRYENNLMPIKTPRIHCQCPPNKECNMEYEINKDIIYFQNLKGIIKDDELMQLKEDLNEKIIRKNNNRGKIINESLILNRKKRHGDVILDSKELTRDCCCPTRIVKIPAFITNKKTTEKPVPAMIPLPAPPPLLPIPLPLPAPIPPPLPAPFPPPLPSPYPPLIPAMPPLPFMPFEPYSNPMIPSYSPAFPPQVGMVPGLPGIVSDDGVINILPFSDVYADVLEKHKDRMIRRKLSKLLYSREYLHRRRWK